MLKSEHYGIHQIKVQNIICSRERGSPVLSGDTQSCGTSDPYRVQNLFLRVGCGPFKHHFANFRHSTTSSLSSFLERYIDADRKKLLLVIARLDKEGQSYTADTVVDNFHEGKELHGIIGYTLELNEN